MPRCLERKGDLVEYAIVANVFEKRLVKCSAGERKKGIWQPGERNIVVAAHVVMHHARQFVLLVLVHGKDTTIQLKIFAVVKFESGASAKERPQIDIVDVVLLPLCEGFQAHQFAQLAIVTKMIKHVVEEIGIVGFEQTIIAEQEIKIFLGFVLQMQVGIDLKNLLHVFIEGERSARLTLPAGGVGLYAGVLDVHDHLGIS